MTHLRMEPLEEGLACQGRNLRLDDAHTMPPGGLAFSLGSDEKLLQDRLLPGSPVTSDCLFSQASLRL